jgi:hypothetical protein
MRYDETVDKEYRFCVEDAKRNGCINGYTSVDLERERDCNSCACLPQSAEVGALAHNCQSEGLCFMALILQWTWSTQVIVKPGEDRYGEEDA